MSDRSWADHLRDEVGARLSTAADPERARGQRRYMRDQFPFAGVATPELRALLRDALSSVGKPTDAADLDTFARRAWTEPDREWQYLAIDVLRRHQKLLGPRDLELMHHLVSTKGWWDTVDAIASHLVGGIVARHPDSATVMDEWVDSPDMWVARTAILHQLRYKDDTDTDRLFAYCLRRADETDFFYRKAIGWALRQYARTDPEAVRAFCASHEDVLSPLSLREARKHL